MEKISFLTIHEGSGTTSEVCVMEMEEQLLDSNSNDFQHLLHGFASNYLQI